MKAVMGTDPPAPPVNPMSLSAPGLFDALCAGAGFDARAIESVESKYPFDFGDDPEFQFKIGTLLLAEALDKLDPDRAVARVAFEENIGKYTSIENGTMLMKNNVFVMATVEKEERVRV